jgi:hypothetical protein
LEGPLAFLLSGQKNRRILAKKVAELFVEVLAAAGVKRIYGVAGDSLNGITDSVRVHKGIEWTGVPLPPGPKRP